VRGRVASLYRWRACSLKDGGSAAVVRRAGRDTAGTGGPSGARPVRPTRRTVGRATREGGLQGALGARIALGRRGASVGAWPGWRGRARHDVVGLIVLLCPCLSTCNSRKLNRSAQSSE
jgi:hypothetical protein